MASWTMYIKIKILLSFPPYQKPPYYKIPFKNMDSVFLYVYLPTYLQCLKRAILNPNFCFSFCWMKIDAMQQIDAEKIIIDLIDQLI